MEGVVFCWLLLSLHMPSNPIFLVNIHRDVFCLLWAALVIHVNMRQMDRLFGGRRPLVSSLAWTDYPLAFLEPGSRGCALHHGSHWKVWFSLVPGSFQVGSQLYFYRAACKVLKGNHFLFHGSMVGCYWLCHWKLAQMFFRAETEFLISMGGSAAMWCLNIFIINLIIVSGFLEFISLILFPYKPCIKIPSLKAYKDT